VADVKFCGMTRGSDVQLASDLGARYVGVIFAESPRRVSAADAARVLGAVPRGRVQRVGVFGVATATEIIAVAAVAGLDCVQLHGGADRALIRAIREAFDGEIWGVARIGPDGLSRPHREMFDLADGVVLDALSARALGGTGETFDWARTAVALGALRRRARLVIAGGLRADNVAAAIETLDPDVVDVSSGVEASPGVKDADRMRAFLGAVRHTNNR
jgi:phosphoribosylanthranilate isomerase